MKRLRSNDRQLFNEEAKALELLNRRSHPHLIHLLASFSHGGDNYLLFPWADGDLTSFLRSQPAPEHKTENSRWFWKQIFGITEGLSLLHSGFGDDSTGIQYYGFHGDVKPSNILIFRDHLNENGGYEFTPKICDFGFTRFHKTDEAVESHEAVTPTYRAPELDLASPRKPTFKQNCDIWSLGCVFSYLATWILLGPSGVSEFETRRAVEKDDGSTCDAYFEWGEYNTIGRTATVKPAVESVKYK